MTKVAQLKALVSLAEVASTAAQTRYGNLKREETQLRQQIAELVTQRNDTAASPRAAGEAALAAGADLRWHRWVDGRVAQINLELARNLSAQINARRELKRAFGRSQALRMMLSQQVEDEAVAQKRRQDWI